MVGGAGAQVGFFGAAPHLQPANTGFSGYVSSTGGTTVKSGDTWTGGLGATAYQIGDIVHHLKILGLIAQ
jgi:hypothetical protein